MLIKSFVLLGVLFAVARSARIPRNIPVEVRYDEITGKELKQQEGLPQQEADLQEIGCSREEILQRLKQEQAPAQAVVATVTEDLGNVRDSLAQESSKEEIASVQPEKTTNLPEQNAEILPASSPTKNLEEKPQLSSQQQEEALKHLPEPEKQENAIILKKLGGSSPGNQLEDLQIVIRQAQDIVSNGIKRIKDFQPEKGQISLNPQQWQDLEKALDEYFDEEKAKLTLKQTSTNTTNQNFFANLASGFQTIATNFVQSIQGSNNASGPADEAGGTGSSPGGWQGFVSFFQGGIQTISNSINNLGGQGSSTSNTVLGDSASTTESQGIFSSFVNNISQGVQTFIGQIQQNGAAAPGGTQGDPGSNATTANQGPIQTGIQQIGMKLWK
ncbi:unnamed protein product [Callosobruchus maculatus]|uniref:Uncharacterized protein n=1 Tax=Callosobruchus maculatus TaxID=64391 RepID=A0A653DNK2_CALMS|nr:unnamed protein product [Callosobruchus maculatus]